MIGELVVKSPVILGHEVAGTIVAVGENVNDERLGRLVAVEPQRPCRVCDYCKRGLYHLCPDMEFYGAWPVDGAFSEYVLIDADFAFDVPENMTAEQAALVEPTSVAVHACRRAVVTSGSSVFITGAPRKSLIRRRLILRPTRSSSIFLSTHLETLTLFCPRYPSSKVVV